MSDKVAAIQEFEAIQDQIIREAVARALQDGRVRERHGEEADYVMSTGFEFFVRFLLTAVAFDESTMIEHQGDWLLTFSSGIGLEPEMHLHNIAIFEDVMRESMSPQAVEAFVIALEPLKQRLQVEITERHSGLAKSND